MAGSLKQAITRVLEHEDQDEQLLLEKLKELVRNFERTDPKWEQSFSIAELFHEYLETHDEELKKDKVISGFDQLDDRLLFNRGELVVIGGRPGMGKTQLMINLAMNMSVNEPVLYISFDESRSEILRRMISNLTDFSDTQIRNGAFNDLENTVVHSMVEEFGSRKLFLNDTSSDSIQDVRELCLKHIQQDGVKVICIDHLQMLHSENPWNKRGLELGDVCQILKDLARSENALVLVSSELGRNVEKRGGDMRPRLCDLRESEEIEQKADKVIFIYRPEYYGFDQDEMGAPTYGVVELILAKNRGGQTVRIELRRNDNFTRVMSLGEYLHPFVISNTRKKDIREDEPPILN